MEKVTIKHIKPMMNGETQAFYQTRQGGINWKFWIILADGREGILEKKKQDLPFKDGDVVDTLISKIGTGTTHKFQKMVLWVDPTKAGPGTHTTRSYGDPKVSMPMAMSMAKTILHKVLIHSIGLSMEFTEEDFYNYSNFFYLWITRNEEETDRDILGRRWYSLEQAVDCIPLPKFNLTADLEEGTGRIIKPLRTKIIELAERNFDHTMSVNEEDERPG